MRNLRKRINWFKSLPNSVVASFTYIVCNVLVRGISFITLPIFTRILDQSEYGILTMYTSWSELFALFGTLTIWGGVFNSGMIHFEGKRESYVSSVQGFGISYSLVFCSICVFLSPQIGSVLKLNQFLIICMFVHIIAQIPYNIWLSAQKFEYKYKPVLLVSIANSIINPILAFILVYSAKSYRVEARVASGVFVELVFGIVLFILNYSKGKSSI